MLHHITAICRDAQTTNDFYTHVLGLRLVKLTINQDDVGTYHLYFGDRVGSPGSVLTFFPWAQLPTGSVGHGIVTVVAFRAPKHSLDYWEQRLHEFAVGVHRVERFGSTVLRFSDPDGLTLEIVETAGASDWTRTVPVTYALLGFAGATLYVRDIVPTQGILVKYFGYRVSANQAIGTVQLNARDDSTLDLLAAPGEEPGVQGLGSVHHIAFRVANAQEQKALRDALRAEYLQLTPVIDRFYFSSVYFREPGGILFEIATDGPGFVIDEEEAVLGTALVLPPQFEPLRAKIEAALPPFTFAK